MMTGVMVAVSSVILMMLTVMVMTVVCMTLPFSIFVLSVLISATEKSLYSAKEADVPTVTARSIIARRWLQLRKIGLRYWVEHHGILSFLVGRTSHKWFCVDFCVSRGSKDRRGEHRHYRRWRERTDHSHLSGSRSALFSVHTIVPTGR